MYNKISCLFFIRDMRGPLSQIRVSLVASLGAGQIIFLTGSGAVENKVRREESLSVNLYDLNPNLNSTFSFLCSLPVLQ